jgi:glycyl-tRNA synthetase
MKKEPLVDKAELVFAMLQKLWYCEYDASGAIGKRYRRQDELGTPFCVTIDFETLENDTVTLRNRDSMQQERVSIGDLAKTLQRVI